jgi:hypothetical protein
VSRRKSPKSKAARAKSGADGQLPLLDERVPDAKLHARGSAAAAAVHPDHYPEDDLAEGELETYSAGGRWTRFWNFIVGVSLLPFCWILTTAIFEAFARANVRGHRTPFWQSHEFLMFAAGAVVWMIWFGFSLAVWKEPRPLRLYVWGHELMHVLFARCFGGKIKDYGITREGGFIVTDRYNFLIALAPYLWPFAAVPVLALWGLVAWSPEVLYYREWFLGALGFTWFFHLSFTAWMIPIGQTDFAGPGKVFSLALIYIVNLALLSLALVALAPEVTLSGYGHELSQSTIAFYRHILTASSGLFHLLLGR